MGRSSDFEDEPMRVLITGAGGQLGSDLVRVLGGSYEVIPVTRAEFDVADFETTLGFCREARPDVIVHSAAFTDVDGCESRQDEAFVVNGLGARNVAIAAREVDAKLFYISTDYVFDGKKEGPYLEFDRPNPLNVYGRSKLLGEQFVKEQMQRFFILRTGWLYGAKGKNFVKTILRLAQEQGELQVVNDQRGTPTWTEDLARQIERLIPLDSYGTYHCTSQGSCTWYEFALEVLKLSGLPAKVRPVTTEEFPRAAKRPKNSVLDNYMLRLQGLDIMPPWRESLGRFMKKVEKEVLIE